MTIVDDPPGTVTDPTASAAVAARSGSASWRFALRLAWRETRRRPGRTVLASLLIAVPVIAMTLGGVLVRTEREDWAASFARNYGDADIVHNPSAFGFASDGPTLPPFEGAFPDGTTADEYLWVSSTITPVDRGRDLPYAVLTDIDLVADGAGQPIEVRDGRAPVVGEILLDQHLADELGVEVGDDLTLVRPSGTWELSGIGRLRSFHSQSVMVVPGFDRDRIDPDQFQVTTVYDLPDSTSDDVVRTLAAGIGAVTPLDDPFFAADGVGRQIAWGWVGGVLALVAVGIIVAAAFATSARRQLVMVGQLASNGATPAAIKRMLAFQGTWTGLLGAAVGIGLGLAALPFVRPWVESMFGRDVAPYRISVGDLAIIVVTAAIAGTAAAAVPARSISQIPVMAALAGRRPSGRLPRWLVPTGSVLVAGGLGVTALAAVASRAGSGSDAVAFALVLGIVAVVFGMICATPLVVELVGSLGRRASLSWRLALRSLARSRTRSSAVIAAIAVAVAGAVAASALIETTMREDRAGQIPAVPADVVVVDQWGTFVDGEGPIDLPLPIAAPLTADLRADLDAVAPGATFAPLRVAAVDPPEFDPMNAVGPWPEQIVAWIADPELLAVVGLDPADEAVLERDGALIPVAPQGYSVYVGGFDSFDRLGDDGTTIRTVTVMDEAGPIVVEAPLARRGYRYDIGGTRMLVTEVAARELGFHIVERGAIVRYDDALTGSQIGAVRTISFAGDTVFDAFVEPGDPPRADPEEAVPGVDDFWTVRYDDPTWRTGRFGDLWIARAIVGGAALLLTLLVVAIGLSLAAAEGKPERDTLTVVGAAPSSMRRQAAARAVVLAVTGVALGIPTGFAPAWVVYRAANISDFTGNSLGFPSFVVLTLAVVVPVVVAVVAWVGSAVGQRYRPPTPTRRD